MRVRLIVELALGVAVVAGGGRLLAQVNTGELRLRVTDSAGLGLKALVTVSSEASQYRTAFVASATGEVDAKALPYGIYLVHVEMASFAGRSELVDVRSTLPVELTMALEIATVTTSVSVSAATPLIDPYRPSTVMQVGSREIEDRVNSLPGRSVQDLVNSQPGWLYEGNGVLHPRGSEYQT